MKLHTPTLTTFIAFSKELISTKDLDPVYVVLHAAHLEPTLLHRVLVAYWCLYHLGAAAHIAETSRNTSNFWKHLMAAARNDDLQWPRGAERRHWRGQQAVRSAQDLAASWRSPTEAVEHWAAGYLFSEVAARVRQSVGFGPWIAFKVADMLERVAGYDVEFSTCELGFYEEPLKGAFLVRDGFVPTQAPTGEVRKEVVQEVVRRLLATPELARLKAPPAYDRRLNVQEAETCLCKFKSFHNGHYHVGKDITEVRHGLTDWGDLAQELLRYVPREVV